MRHFASALALVWAGVTGTWAADVVVVVENRNYRSQPDVRAALDRIAIKRASDAAGGTMFELLDASAERARDRFSERIEEIGAADRIMFIVAGHVVTDGRSNWLLAPDAPRGVNMFTVGAYGLRVDALLNVLSARPGAAYLLVAPAAAGPALGPGLEPGFTARDIPQGVTVASGPAEAVSDLLAEDVVPMRLPAGLAVDRRRALTGAGFLPRSTLPGTEAQDQSLVQEELELSAWETALEDDTVEAYEDFLRVFPDGLYADAAREGLAALQPAANPTPQQAEDALALNRNARAEIQRNLSILGHDPRGIDGIFGRGTRTAIRDWQGANAIESTGFLTGNQIARLQEAAIIRQAELEAEADRRRQETERQDTAYWQETGSGTSEEGTHAYLERYPDGVFSDLARERLAEVEAAHSATARAADREAWEAARSQDTAAAYSEYRRVQPDGEFRPAAEARMRELRAASANAEEIAAARTTEEQILSNQITRLLVERRLEQLGLEPGLADGGFNDDTRRAIRRYQSARDLPVTGYVSQDTLVRMLAGN